MQKLTVQSTDLSDQAREVNTGASDVEQILTRLSGQITQLASNWAGGASQAFHDRWDEWNRGAEQVKVAMEDMARFLQNAADAYEQTEEQVRSAASR